MGNLPGILTSSPLIQKWFLSNYGTLKINTDITFLKDKISIGIRNHMNIPLLARTVPQHGSFFVDFD